MRGKSLLHLQCHFGLDTISWARLGAKVTGIDFSDTAIELARKIARKAGVDAEFNLLHIPNPQKRTANSVAREVRIRLGEGVSSYLFLKLFQ